ncbi:efflux RND transporter permease subunit [Pseudomonas helleri]|uniref:Efflux pump membrane transporter n=1 Tax=Pseudomonas helleri TaxID=1608996 RepID=A0A6A7YZL9_9PSED|nr:efflux RND transporter permease subunit [Pseudomonas helleri]MQT25579.1 efflux RND transporter permease subunit [Pseudomonas helleri]MQT80927.1 efflux RND transporter permease subunit [Pseudomonas helleri]MQU17080.1 efflux RND transporter permease subunit [Pseudomonas helleri]MQU26745.1 efflux RND transporter permease subunit [Pseudomonas helleri]
MARFFIDRPIFAWVIAIVIMLAGALSITQLPLEQYPDIAPPTVKIAATYTGASAKTVEDSVTQVIEQQMTGIDKLTYMSASSSSAGSASINLTFEAGTDPDVAQMQVQNKLQQVESRLPSSVQSEGLTVTKGGSDFLMIAALASDNPSVTGTQIGDYISSTLLDSISRIDGVGEVKAMGSGYAMRIWLDPALLEKYSLMPSDVSTALEAQNTEVSAGQLGALPATAGQQLNATITARSKLQTAEEFRNVVVKSNSAGAVVLLGEVATVELGSDSYDVNSALNGKPSAAMGVQLATGANALKVGEAVKAKLAELEPYYPSEMQLKNVIAYDTTPFVSLSIEEVVKSLGEAIVLVVLIMFLFLQNFRATLIPAITVPVVLLGTFGVLAIFGYSINTLTMFAMVLAIGLLVDDAIVVVENAERVMSEKGLSPLEATRQSMDEITSALIGIALVLSAVFIPMAFFSGSTGIIYRQFSVTIVSAMVLSVLVAMTLTPALCATLLKPVDPNGHGPQTGFFGWFNRTFERGAQAYQAVVGKILQRSGRSLMVYVLVVAAMAVGYIKLPTSFLPDEDQGILMAQMQLPVGATDDRTQAVLKQFESYILQQPEVEAMISISGMGMGGNSQNSARAFIRLKDWSERTGAGQDSASIAQRATQALSSIGDADVFVMQPPAVRGLGQSSGFDLQLKDVAGLGHEALVAAREQLIELAKQDPRLQGVRSNGLDDTPQLKVTIDDRKAGALSLTTSDINTTLSTALGGSYVNDFLNQGRVKKVYVQGQASSRMQADDLDHWFVRNSNDEMVPFSSFASSSWTSGSPLLERYNGSSSLEVVGDPAPGVSSGVAMDAVESIIKQLPEGISYEWTGQSYQLRLSGSQAPLLYAISVLFVFLCLAALYESWSVPFSVMLVVPLGVVGAVLATRFSGLSNDVYFQVGLLTTVGLAAKNAILIVEFAKHLQEQGNSLIDATLIAVRQRLRPILMTSLAFMFGVLPLAMSSGAGSAGRQAIGTGVLGGMFSATVLGIFFVPLFFVLIRRRFSRVSTPTTDRTGEA